MLCACHPYQAGSGSRAEQIASRQDAAFSPSKPESGKTAAAVTGSRWGSLDAFVGKYPADSGLLENSPISGDLETLLAGRFVVLQINLQTASPLQRDGTILYLSGNRAHQGGSDAAYLLIAPGKFPDITALEVGLWESGQFSLYKTPGTDIPKPKDIQILISNFSKF